MAPKMKKRQLNQENLDDDSSSDSAMSGSDDEEGKTINVEFEAQTPVESDFHGIKQLLLRAFLLLHVDMSELTDLIIAQNTVGSTIKIVDDEDDEVFGIVSLIGLKKHESKACIRELQKEVMTKCKNSATDEVFTKLKTILATKSVGYLINERFINIPPQIAVPFHNSLREEVQDAEKDDNMFHFDYLLLLSKTLKPSVDELDSTQVGSGSSQPLKKKKKKQKSKTTNDEIEYTNIEDEIFHKESEISFSYDVTAATGLAVGGSWDFTDQAMRTYRTVMLIPTAKWKCVTESIEEMVK